MGKTFLFEFMKLFTCRKLANLLNGTLTHPEQVKELLSSKLDTSIVNYLIFYQPVSTPPPQKKIVLY
jgi:hypothetical protein